MNEVRTTEMGAEMHIRVNGEWRWRSCSMTREDGMWVAEPELRDGEQLLRSIDGQCQIVIVMGIPSAPRVITRVMDDGVQTKDGAA